MGSSPGCACHVIIIKRAAGQVFLRDRDGDAQVRVHCAVRGSYLPSLRWTSRRAGSAGGAGPRGGDVQGRRGDVRGLGLTGGALAALAHGTGKYAPAGQEVCGGPRRGRAMGS